MSAMNIAGLDNPQRRRLAAVGDALIPEAHGMPAASHIGLSDNQVDQVLAVRPDLRAPLTRALGVVTASDQADVEQQLAALEEADPEAAEALLQVVVGGYYIHPEVRQRLGYDGQVPVEVRPEIIPNYVEQGLIDPVIERGRVYRLPDDEAGPV